MLLKATQNDGKIALAEFRGWEKKSSNSYDSTAYFHEGKLSGYIVEKFERRSDSIIIEKKDRHFKIDQNIHHLSVFDTSGILLSEKTWIKDSSYYSYLIEFNADGSIAGFTGLYLDIKRKHGKYNSTWKIGKTTYAYIDNETVRLNQEGYTGKSKIRVNEKENALTYINANRFGIVQTNFLRKYDVSGNLVQYKSFKGHKVYQNMLITYDFKNRKIKEISINPDEFIECKYDDDDNIIYWKDIEGRDTTVSTNIYSREEKIQHYRKNKGEINELTEYSYTTIFTYDEKGRKIHERTEFGGTENASETKEFYYFDEDNRQLIKRFYNDKLESERIIILID